MRARFRQILDGLVWTATLPVLWLLAVLRGRRRIVTSWTGTPLADRKRVLVFAHQAKDGHVAQTTLDYLRELQANGLYIVFVSNAGYLREPALAAVKAICPTVVIRKKGGGAFSAWAEAIAQLRLFDAQLHELILASDRVYGPFLPLRDVLLQFDYEKSDAWALTEAWNYRYHLQCYFLGLGPKALANPAIARFWDGIWPVPSAKFVLRKYEIGLTHRLLRAGLRCQSVWKYDALIRSDPGGEFAGLVADSETETGKIDPVTKIRLRQALHVREQLAERIGLDPLRSLWRQLLNQRFPFIDANLLRSRPKDAADIGDWPELVQELFGADPRPIIEDLRLRLKNTTP